MATLPQDPIIIKKLAVGVQTQQASSRTAADSVVANSNQPFYNKSIVQLRAQGQILKAIRTLARVDGDVSAAVAAQVRLANTELRFEVYGPDQLLSKDGSDLLRAIIDKMNFSSDYSMGYNDNMALSGVQETLLRSVPLTGACAAELVLDKQRLPLRIQPISVESLRFTTTKANIGSTFKVVPMQTSNAGNVVLDYPTVFYAALDQDLETVYPFSPLEPALNTSIYHGEVHEQVRRVVSRSGHSRLMVKLVLEQVLKAAPVEIKTDSKKLSEWVEAQRDEIVRQIESLAPESALVFYDSVETEYLNSQIGQSADYTPYFDAVNALLATSLKTPAAIVGKRQEGGSQNTSSTESLLFIKTCEGLHPPVEVILSRVFTLCLRLYGFQGNVKAKFEKVDLRPELELEAFKIMQQARVLELLSIGFLGEDEAAELLNCGPVAVDVGLSGSMFYKGNGNAAPPSPNGDPARAAMTPATKQTAAGGRDNAQR